MKTNFQPAILRAALALAATLAGCATPPTGADLGAQFTAMMRGSFRAEGIATMDRIEQDAAQTACSTGQPPDAATAQRIIDEAAATVRPPSDGRYLGDWRKGEALAQSGRGMTWTDASASPSSNGANCYNCHQITKAEIAYGTIGPSLYQYGRLRGVRDPADAGSQAIVRYTWGKIFNSWAFAACSNMPRFGHKRLLDEAQMKDVMALLLDPASPVNAQ